MLGLALVGSVGSARAEPPTDRFSLDYAAAVGCPERAHFVRAVLSRAEGAREVDRAASGYRFEATLEGTETEASGTLRVHQPGGVVSERKVPPATCQEVMDSMAVIISLILMGKGPAPAESTAEQDGAAEAPVQSATPATAAGQAFDSNTPPAPAAQAAPPPNVDGAAVAPVAPVAPAAASPQPPAETRALPSSDTEARPRWRPGLAIGGFVEGGAFPDPTPGVRAGADLWLQRPALWSPSFRAGVLYAASTSETQELGSALFRLLALRANACPIRLPAHPRLMLRPCLVFDLGQLEVEGRDTPGTPQTRRMPWLGAGAAARLEAKVLELLSLEAEGSLLALSRADRFTFEPDAYEVHQVPRLSIGFSLMAAIRPP